MVSQAEEYVERLKNEYIDNQIKSQERDLLIQDNNIEKEQIKGYHGREILELLQNADDAFQKMINEGKVTKCDLEVNIDYDEKNHILRVANTGTFFDYDGIKAIVQGNNSTKKGKYIGNKGTGFRSILNWAEEVKIVSGDFHVGFSEEFAKDLLDEYKGEQQIKKQLDKDPNLHFPILAVPYNLKDYQKYDKDKTIIEVIVNFSKNQDDYAVVNQIQNIDMRILLFMPNISKIQIDINGTKILYQKKRGAEGRVVLRKIVSEQIEKEEHFRLFTKVIEKELEEDNVRKDIDLAIAVPEKNDNFQSQYLYSYFPLLNTQSPFNCIMHASYALSANRNTVDLSSNNKKIIEYQIDFLCDIITDLVKENKFEMAYNILVPQNFPQNIFSGKNWNFPTPFIGIEDVYYEKISKIALFQTVNGKIISLLDNPKTLDNNFPDIFRGEPFVNLLRPITDNSLFKFMDFLARRNNISLGYEESELCEKINAISHLWSKEDQVSIFIWWNNKYKTKLPNLLKKQNGDWIKFGQECYFLDGNWQSNDIPEWVKIPAIDKEYQEILFKQLKNSPEILSYKEKDSDASISRLICQSTPPIISCVNFKYRDRSNIITTINSSVDTYDKAVEYIKWLWKNYGNDSNWQPPKGTDTSKIKYNFPCLSGVKDSDKLYFGSKYHNFLANHLFDEEYDCFSDPEEFGVEIDIEAFKAFISKFGVKDYPNIEQAEMQGNEIYESYVKICQQNIDTKDFPNPVLNISVAVIDDLPKILKNLSTEDVFKWIVNDTKLQNHLRNSSEGRDGKINYRTTRQSIWRNYEGNVGNYILEIFNEEKWIKIGNEKFSPRDILVYSSNNMKFCNFVPVVAISFNTSQKVFNIEELAKNIEVDIDKIQEILGYFEFKKQITDLSSNTFYSVLLQISKIELSQGIDLCKTIYNIIQQPTFRVNYDTSVNKTKFFTEGKMLVKFNGKLQFICAKNAILPSNAIINKKNLPIVEKGLRTNSDNFVEVFGCKKYERTYEIDVENIEVSTADQKFQNYFSEFKKYASAFRERNANIAKQGKNLSIKLAAKIPVIEKNSINFVEEEYSYINSTQTNWYVKVTGENFDVMRLANVIKDIYEHLANTPGFDAAKLRELFSREKKSDRELLIEDEFGTLDVIEEKSYADRVKGNFFSRIRQFKNDYDFNTIDIDFFDFTENNFDNSQKIIEIFKQLNIDVKDFCDKNFDYPINLMPYFEKKVRDFIADKCKYYKNFLYTQALNDETKQKTFFADCEAFENYRLSENINTVYFDTEQYIKNKFKFDISDISQWMSADNAYENNYDKLNPKDLFGEEISNDYNVQQIIYFNKSEEFKNWLNKQTEKVSHAPNQSVNDDYSQYKDKIPQETEINYRESIPIVEGTHHQRNGTYNLNKDIETKKKNKKCGNIGELLIYNLLCSKYGENNVFPRSEAFIDLKILKPGQARSGDYDLSYIADDGVEYFVEVKTGKEGLFYISESELDYAKKNSDKYKLFCVFNIEQENPNYIELPKKFWEDERYKLEYDTKILVCTF
ncbi:MAG: DUF3883 domain-containing protein [Alphaproteobacteria bacterium]|nr:DUF3883 domain-containing protein [Alphaproteobacteria bacterium]